MKEKSQFNLARKALKKLHPDWMLFIDEVMDLVFPFWEGTQSKEQVHFIHLIGYGKRQKSREILTDLIELLDWESESIFLWRNWELGTPSPIGQVIGMQESFPRFPKVVLTDFMSEFLEHARFEDEPCDDFNRIQDFLRNRTFLDLQPGVQASDARGTLIISYLDTFGDSDFVRTRLMFQFILQSTAPSIATIRRSFVPEELPELIDEGYIQREELVFFSKDEPRHIMLALELLKIKEVLEDVGREMLQVPIRLSFGAMDYFICYTFYKKLSNAKLRQAALDFFLPVFWQYGPMTKKIKPKPSQVQLDFQGGWRFQAIID
jgi:hypothetical protein